MNKLLQQLIFVCVCLLILSGQVMADSVKNDAFRALTAGNYTMAEKLYRQLAINGDADAQGYLGFLYLEGKGVIQDYKEAAKWYRLAAEQNDTDAQMRLAIIYADGLGVPRDLILAHMWFNISASNEKDGKAAVVLRNELAKQMNSAQISKAQELARKCISNHFKSCQ